MYLFGFFLGYYQNEDYHEPDEGNFRCSEIQKRIITLSFFNSILDLLLKFKCFEQKSFYLPNKNNLLKVRSQRKKVNLIFYFFKKFSL